MIQRHIHEYYTFKHAISILKMTSTKSEDIRVISDINVSGTLRNTLNQGFDERDGVCEEMDNSLDAGATRIRVTLDWFANKYIHADNGRGMNEDELSNAFVLNNRSEASASKFGRFGIGGLQAKMYLTQLTGKTITISKRDTDKSPSHIIANWPRFVETNQYRNIATGASRENEEYFEKYVSTPFGSNNGTVQIYECDRAIFEKMQLGLSSRQIKQSYIYYLEVKYYQHLVRGVIIEVDIGGVLTILRPIDPLRMETIPENRKRTTALELYRHKNTDSVYVRTPAGWIARKPCRRWNKTVIEQEPPVDMAELEKVDDCMHESAFADWHEEQSDLFKDGRFECDWTTDHKGAPKIHQKIAAYMGGKYYRRNDAVVKRIDSKKSASGDKARYKFQDNSRHRFTYTSNIDPFMKTQVNKSELKEELICQSLKRSLEYLENDFVEKMYDNFKREAEEAEKAAAEAEAIAAGAQEPAYNAATTIPSPVVEHTSQRANNIQVETITHIENIRAMETEPDTNVILPDECTDIRLHSASQSTPSVRTFSVSKHERSVINKQAAIQYLTELQQMLESAGSHKIPKSVDVNAGLTDVLAETVEPKHAAVFKHQWLKAAVVGGPMILIYVLIGTYEKCEHAAKVPGGATLHKLMESIKSSNTTKSDQLNCESI